MKATASHMPLPFLNLPIGIGKDKAHIRVEKISYLGTRQDRKRLRR
jgi:hypothetical protein